MELFGETIQILEKALDLRTVNQRVIASNIANIDTPGYQSQKLNFEASMQAAIAEIQAAQMQISSAQELDAFSAKILGTDGELTTIIEPNNAMTPGLDGNTVDMDAELGALSRNGLMYQMTLRMLASKMREFRIILEGGG